MRKLWAIAVCMMSGLLAVPPASASDCYRGPWTVYFDYDVAEITPDTYRMLELVRSNYGGCGNYVILEGHTDTALDSEHNMALSLRMVRNVSAFLKMLGISEGYQEQHAYGETRPAVATGDGVREPANRRVVIRIEPLMSGGM